MKTLLLIVCLLTLVGCTQTVTEPTQVTITKTWTAPGDDGMIGQASAYDGRYATSVDSLENHWDYCISWTVPAVPAPSGQTDVIVFTITIDTEIDYFFAIKTRDEVGNWSPISNIKIENVPDTIPPAAITDLQ